MSGVFPNAVPASPAVFQTRLPWQGVGYGQGFREGPRHKAVLSFQICHTTALQVPISQDKHFQVDYTQKNTVIQKHFRLLISILRVHHFYLLGGRGWKR